MPTLIGAFDAREVAQQALERLAERGIARDDMKLEAHADQALLVANASDTQVETAERTLAELGAKVRRNGRPSAVPSKDRPLAGKTLTVTRRPKGDPERSR